MANSITSVASFATANMKPVPDEQIDALWGQNIADNTGFLRASGQAHMNWVGTDGRATTTTSNSNLFLVGSFVNPVFIGQNHNTMCGTVDLGIQWSSIASTPPDVTGTWVFSIEGDLGTYSVSGGTNGSNVSDMLHSTTVVINTSLGAYVTPNRWANVALRAYGSAISLSSVTSNTIAYTFGQAPKIHTVWT
jgi:hypothetical protein